MHYPTRMMFKRGLRPAIIGAILCAIAAGLFCIYETRNWVSQYGLEAQVYRKEYRAKVLDDMCGASPSDVLSLNYASPGERDEVCVVERGKSRQCLVELKSLIGDGENLTSQIEINGQSILRIKACGFEDNTFYGKFKKDSPKNFLFSLVCGAMGFFGVGLAFVYVFWISAYPHLGWVRLISVLSPILGGLAGWWWYEYQESEVVPVLGAGIVAAFLSSVMLLAGREVVLWVKAGFVEKD